MTIVTATLEGMRVSVEERICRLEEYHFVTNQFNLVEEAAWPMPAHRVRRWLSGWNRVDKLLAIATLTSPDDPTRLEAL